MKRLQQIESNVSIERSPYWWLKLARAAQRPAYVSKSVISQCDSVVSFRLMSGNDQDAIINYTEYGSRAVKQYLAGLADHEAFICGIAVPCRFLIVETRVKDYPRKSTEMLNKYSNR